MGWSGGLVELEIIGKIKAKKSINHKPQNHSQKPQTTKRVDFEERETLDWR
jgi:hypothetical protein